jgi:hypothetical protein
MSVLRWSTARLAQHQQRLVARGGRAVLLELDDPPGLAAPEHQHQAAVCRWARLNHAALPALQLLYAVPNGARRSRGERGWALAEGLRAGVPDLVLPVPAGPWHGLYIEMKSGTGVPSIEQEWWLGELARLGHRTAICRSFAEARACLLSYLGPA